MIRRVCCVALLLASLFLSGCVLNTILDDVVNSYPRSVIDAQPTEGVAPLTVALDAHYSRDDDGSIAEYRWELGDPTSVTGSQLGSTCTHTYADPGTYLVKLSVTDNEGATDSQQIAIVVKNAPPVPQATVSDPTPYPGDTVTFDASASYDVTGTIASYAWEFGDGSAGDGVTVTHIYAKGGSYTVTLTTTDDEGASSDTALTVTVKTGSSNCGEDDCGDDAVPIAVINGLRNGCSNYHTVNVPVTLDGLSSRSEGGKIVRYEWSFGDGSTTSGPTVTHTYYSAGTYLVTLTVTDEAGGVGTSAGYDRVFGSSGAGCS
ncbi:MAG: PKD domain-containing protein [Candidatus Bipolaricaulis sp.]|nr:PKD domain-containing protein [Candidatus Bipolaricaulis sp.]